MIVLRDGRSQKTSSPAALNLGEQLATTHRRKPKVTKYFTWPVTSGKTGGLL